MLCNSCVLLCPREIAESIAITASVSTIIGRCIVAKQQLSDTFAITPMWTRRIADRQIPICGDRIDDAIDRSIVR
jgi:hypothetical protein